MPGLSALLTSLQLSTPFCQLYRHTNLIYVHVSVCLCVNLCLKAGVEPFVYCSETLVAYMATSVSEQQKTPILTGNYGFCCDLK